LTGRALLALTTGERESSRNRDGESNFHFGLPREIYFDAALNATDSSIARGRSSDSKSLEIRGLDALGSSFRRTGVSSRSRGAQDGARRQRGIRTPVADHLRRIERYAAATLISAAAPPWGNLAPATPAESAVRCARSETCGLAG
jgi:hypothetical protein